MSLYEDLGVDRDATPADIKKAYKRKAQKAHPDKGGNVESFQIVQRAHAVLSDATRREHYDRTGEAEIPRDSLMDELAGMVANVIDLDGVDVETTDIMGMIRRGIERGIGDLQDAIKNHKGLIRKRQQALKRLKKKGTGDNVIAAVIEAKIAQAETKIVSIKASIDHGNKLIELSQTYEYEFDTVESRRRSFMDTARYGKNIEEDLRRFFQSELGV